MATCKPLCHTPYKFMLNWIYSCATILKSRVWRRCLIASCGQPSTIRQLALQPINYIEIHVTKSLSQTYKSKDFKIFRKTTRFELTMLSIGLRGQWKWSLSINPLEAIIVLAILSDVKIIKNYPIVTVTVDNTTILHCQFLRKLDNRLVAQVEFESTLYGFWIRSLCRLGYWAIFISSRLPTS